MGSILAWDQLRTAGRSGSASADALMAFAQRGDWTAEMLATAEEMTQATRQQWQNFAAALAAQGSATAAAAAQST